MTTKTKDPVAEAEAGVIAAVEVLEAAKENDRQLRQKVLDSEGVVTAQELAESAMGIDHATLGAEAARLRYQRAQEAARLDRLRELRAEIYATGSADEMTAAMRTAIDGVKQIIILCATRRDNYAQWRRTMTREGVTNGREVTDENAGLGWFESDWDTGALVVDGHNLRVIRPDVLLGAVLLAAAKAAGEPIGYLGALSPPHDADASADPEAWAHKTWGSL